MSQRPSTVRVRREPPRFRQLAVVRRQELGPRMVRVTVAGDELVGFDEPAPAASVRVLLPEADSWSITLPGWNGNEFLYGDGSRPVIRTLTPRHYRPAKRELDLDVVLHGNTALASWARSAPVGSPAAVSGPGRGYEIDPRIRRLLLVGDESAIPAISQLMEVVPPDISLTVVVEVADPSGRVPLPERPSAEVVWTTRPGAGAPGDAMVDSVRSIDLTEDTGVWVAGEAAAVQAIRRDLLGERSVPRSRAVIRGYWKRGRKAGST